jgi:hypothetical protein
VAMQFCSGTTGSSDDSGGYVSPPSSEPTYVPPSSPDFGGEQISGNGPPELIVINDSDLEMTINVSGPESQSFTVAPREERTIRIAAGTYSLNASAPDVASTSRTELLQSDYVYRWTLSVVTGP